MKTTLNKIRACSPCQSGWKTLLSFLGKTEADDEELSLLTILEANGLQDTLWCFRAVDGFDKEKRLFAVFCARQVEHLLKDERSKIAINVAEKFANGEASVEELEEARRNAAYAYAAAAYAAYAAAAAAYAAAYAAAAYAAYAAYAAAYAARQKARSEQKNNLCASLKKCEE